MRIVFVFAGLLEYKGRLLKQISTLQEAGHECILIHGQKEDNPPDYSKYSFDVFPYRLIRHPKKLNNYYNHMRFNFQAARKAAALNPDAVVCVQLVAALSGILLRSFKRSLKYIFDCNELFMEMGMNKFKKLSWEPIHTLAFRKADVILHAEQNRMLFCEKHYTNSANHILLENLPRVNIDSLEHIIVSDQVRAVYVGALIPGRYCEEIILAFSNIPTSTASCDIIGFGEENYINSLKSLVSEQSITNVRILPPVSNAAMLKALTHYDVGFAFYSNNNLNQYYCAPNKVYDYIVTGLPVITNNYPGLLNVVAKNRIGICLDEISPESIRGAVKTIALEQIAQNITKEIKTRYTWKNQEATYLSIFQEHESLSWKGAE